MKKLLLISFVILVVICSRSWAKNITPRYEPNEVYAESDCQQIRSEITYDMDTKISTDNMTAASLACISIFGR